MQSLMGGLAIQEAKAHSSKPSRTGQPLVFKDVDAKDASLTNAKDIDLIVDMIVLKGVAPVEAKTVMCNITRANMPVTFHEVYGRGGLSQKANKLPASLRVKGLRAIDLRTTRPDGEAWDFTRKADRKLALRLLDEEDPEWVVGAPPCTAFCQPNLGTTYSRMDPKEVERRIQTGLVHLKTISNVYKRQMATGRFFLHEHPRGASSWRMGPIRQLLLRPRVVVTTCHQCQYGLITPTASGHRAHALKPARFMPNSYHMLKRRSKACDGTHAHHPLTSGRAADAAFYPTQLLQAILHGMVDTRDAQQQRSMLAGECWDVNLTMVIQQPPIQPRATTTLPNSPIPTTDGGTVHIHYHPHNFKQQYIPEYTREVRPLDLVKQAVVEELNYVNSKVWGSRMRRGW